MKLLLDTNVLIDYFSRRQPFFQDAVKLRIAAMFEDVELWASSQSFSDIEYVLRRAIPLQQLRLMMKESLKFLRIAAPASTDVAEALGSDWLDLEDFLVARCAQRIEADYLITRDERGFQSSQISCMSPTSFINMLSVKYGVEYDEIELPD